MLYVNRFVFSLFQNIPCMQSMCNGVLFHPSRFRYCVNVYLWVVSILLHLSDDSSLFLLASCVHYKSITNDVCCSWRICANLFAMTMISSLQLVRPFSATRWANISMNVIICKESYKILTLLCWNPRPLDWIIRWNMAFICLLAPAWYDKYKKFVRNVYVFVLKLNVIMNP